MIGRRSIVGLSLLSALLFSAFVAQSAFGAFVAAEHTTAFTCLSGETRDYTDAHCDNAVAPGTGSFGHKEIAPGTATAFEYTNAATKNSTTEPTPAVLESTIGGVVTKITASTATGTGTIENFVPATGQMQVKGKVKGSYTVLTVDEPEHCEVENNEIKLEESEFKGVKEGTKMGLEFKPVNAENVFAKFKLKGASCALNGVEIKVKGSVISTAGGGAGGTARPEANGSGATSIFEPGNGMESLKIGTVEAKFTSTVTNKMTAGNPIALTTTNP
jgi:hypothetical protein